MRALGPGSLTVPVDGPPLTTPFPHARSPDIRSISHSKVLTVHREGSFTFFVLRPLSDLFLRIGRRITVSVTTSTSLPTTITASSDTS
jgi:hypothetical protein